MSELEPSWLGFAHDFSDGWLTDTLRLRNRLLEVGITYVEAVRLAFGLPYDEERKVKEANE